MPVMTTRLELMFLWQKDKGSDNPRAHSPPPPQQEMPECVRMSAKKNPRKEPNRSPLGSIRHIREPPGSTLLHARLRPPVASFAGR